MVGGYGKRGRQAAAAAAALLVSAGFAPAFAADLGGDCCADLEERVAELEATTVRKGNRKVSLTVSGWVNQAVFFWDDGSESNAYVGTNGLEQDRFRFTGEAEIAKGWSAGYILEIGINGADSKAFSQDSTGAKNDLTTRKSAWFIKSKEYGKVTVGKFDTATYHLIDNVDTLLTRNVSDYEASVVGIGAFVAKSGKTWSSYTGGFQNGSPGQDALRNIVRYDTPTIAGFTASAAWGEDDQWDIALNYRNTLGDFLVNGALGYGESSDSVINKNQCTVAASTGDCQWWGIGGLVQHVPTGIYVYGGYGSSTIDLKPGVVADDESNSWYIQSGIERKWLPFGNTNVFGEYRKDDVGESASADGSDIKYWAGGVAQKFDSADLTLYAVYRHYEGEFVVAGDKGDLGDFDLVITGAKINF